MLFNWDVSRIQRSFWGQVFEAFATGICVLTVQNMVTAELDIGPILSVCVLICVSARLFNFLQAAFWTSSSMNSIVIS